MTEAKIEMLTTMEVCGVLQCSRRTVVNYISRGLLSPARLSQRKNLFRADEIMQLVERHTNNDAAVVRAALALLAEHHAEDKRPMCSDCQQRRVRPGTEKCTPCHEAAELQLQHKLNWWHKTGSAARSEARAKAKAAASA
jgi:hypothetical protein